MGDRIINLNLGESSSERHTIVVSKEPRSGGGTKYVVEDIPTTDGCLVVLVWFGLAALTCGVALAF